MMKPHKFPLPPPSSKKNFSPTDLYYRSVQVEHNSFVFFNQCIPTLSVT